MSQFTSHSRKYEPGKRARFTHFLEHLLNLKRSALFHSQGGRFQHRPSYWAAVLLFCCWKSVTIGVLADNDKISKNGVGLQQPLIPGLVSTWFQPPAPPVPALRHNPRILHLSPTASIPNRFDKQARPIPSGLITFQTTVHSNHLSRKSGQSVKGEWETRSWVGHDQVT